VRARRVGRLAPREPRAGEILARRWELALEEARASGQTLFPGPIYGLAAFRGSAHLLELDLHETDYREFVGTNLSPEYLALPRESAPRADALGVSVLLLAGEHVVLHRRGPGCFEWPLAIDTPGGHVEPGRHLDARGEPDPFAAALDELEGELGLHAEEVLERRALALTRIAGTEKPQLVIAARTRVSLDEIRRRLEEARDRFETSELLPVGFDELPALESANVTPAGRAAIRFAREMLA
jgi:8-oxo-dGTP pyrophosphatase MutT (NUDIX family)